LQWSPVAAATTWDEALHTARAMTLAAPALGRGTSHEQHWSERAAALLAPLLHAAHLCGDGISGVLAWVLRHELQEPTDILEQAGRLVAMDVLHGIQHTDERERSSIFSAAAGVLALYNTDAAREAASKPNFDPDLFAASSDTIYITAPAHGQGLCAPLVVGLLEQIRHATYRRAASHPGAPPVFFCLDEVANIAPIHDLPALVSEAGGQGLHVMACLQDLSQARTRWGDQAADGFLTLFQTKLVLPGISDPRTLEALSVVLGEIDRPMPSTTTGVSETRTFAWMAPPTTTRSHSVGYNTVRQRRVPPGEIAAIAKGHGLLVTGATRQRLRLTPYHACEPWRTLTQARGSLLAGGGSASYPDRNALPVPLA
jgi:type IV secretion system protein VirD4